MILKSSPVLLGGLLLAGLLWNTGYEAGKRHQSEAHASQAASARQKAEEASQRASTALTELVRSTSLSDAKLTTLYEGLSHENDAPDRCSIDADRVLRLDQIR